jgi:hypothetical protein
VNEVPADRAAALAVAGGEAADVVTVAAGDPRARADLDAPQLLDVDMNQLARSLALVALGRRQPQMAKLAPGRSA